MDKLFSLKIFNIQFKVEINRLIYLIKAENLLDDMVKIFYIKIKRLKILSPIKIFFTNL